MDLSLINPSDSNKLDKNFIASIRSRQLGKSKCKTISKAGSMAALFGSDTSQIHSIDVNQINPHPPTEAKTTLNKDFNGANREQKFCSKAKNQDDVHLSSLSAQTSVYPSKNESTPRHKMTTTTTGSAETFRQTSPVPKSEKTEHWPFFLEHTHLVNSISKSGLLMNQNHTTAASSIKSIGKWTITVMKEERDQDKNNNDEKKGCTSQTFPVDSIEQFQYVPNSSMVENYPEDELLLFDDDVMWKEFVQAD